MSKISVKLLTFLAIFLFLAIVPIVAFATNEDISIVVTKNDKLKQEYTIYIKGVSTQNFKYAFTNNKDADPEGMDLFYINSKLDFSGNQAALLDATTYEKLFKDSSTIYMWAKIKDEEGNEKLILKGIQLDLEKKLTEENLEQIETLTTRIEVEIADSEEETTTVRNENINGVDEVANVGYVKIVDDKNATYYYERIKLPNLDEYNQLRTLAEQAKSEYNNMDMYEKIQFATKFNEVFSKVTANAKWEKVENMMIQQSEESKDGDQYIVLLKKVEKINGNEVITLDIQFLTSEESYEPNVIVEEIITHETTKLPITYDSIALFIVLGIISILIIVVLLRIKKISKQNEK